MAIKNVFVIFHPYLNEKLYYVYNTEWDFEIKKAYYFKTEELAQTALNRLQGTHKKEIESQGLYTENLAIEARSVEVREYLP